MDIDYFIFTPTWIQRFPKQIKFRVYLLEARLSALGKKFGLHNLDPNIVQYNVYHTGIGFQSTDVSLPYEFYFDYLSLEIGIDTFLPKIVTLPNGQETLEWNNKGFVCIGLSIDRNYWEQSTYIGNISSEQLVVYQNWILNTYIPTNNYYVYARVIQGLTRDSIYSPLLRSSICDDFCYTSFNYYKSTIGMCIDYPTAPFETIVAYIVNGPSNITQLNFNDPVQRKFIIDYYKQLYQYIEQSFNYTSQIQQLNNDINQLTDPQEKSLALKSLQLDDQTGRYIIAAASQNFTYTILYTYSPQNNSLQYYKIDFVNIFVNYIESNLKRTITAININGDPVVDEYTAPSNQICSSNGEGNSKCSQNSALSTTLVVMLVLNVILFVIFIIYFIAQLRKY